MSFKLLQRVRILDSSEAHLDVHGMEGVVIQLKQLPGDHLPSISVFLDKNVIDDLEADE